MRYLFRGKSIRYKKWVYGFYWNPKERFSKESNIICDINNGDRFEEVHPETVGIFTGMHDRNNERIWSNSWIVNDSRNSKKPHKVRYIGGAFQGFYNGTFYLIANELKEIEVTENPELI